MADTDWHVRRIGSDEAAVAAPLFAAYLEFYGRDHDVAAAHAWLEARLSRDEAVVLVAVPPDGEPVGFTQLYPGFSSVGLRPAWVLNDLYVAEQARGQGVAERLLSAAGQLAREAGCATLSLETKRDNQTAQRLYRRLGWVEESDYLTFTLELPDPARPE